MKSDLKNSIKKTADFLGKSISNEEIEQLNEHLQLEAMKKNPSCNFQDLKSLILDPQRKNAVHQHE